MGRKRNPYIQLFTRDILSSPRCRALSESAAGVYLFLLCRLNEPPTPGAYRISDWELHPTWKRSCTQQCLATPDKQARLQYFAKMLSKNDLPWKTATILGGLQELYKYGIITVDGDMLVQPRMYKDNGFDLSDLDNDGTILDDPASGSMALRGDDDFTENKGANNGAVLGTQNGTQKVQKKVRDSHAPAVRAMSVENMSNIDNSEGNKGGTGGVASCKNPCKNKKTLQRTLEGGKKPANGLKSSGVINVSLEAGKHVSEPEKAEIGAKTGPNPKAKKPSVADNPPTIEEVQAYFEERAQQGKPFIYVTPEGFYDACLQSGWSLKDGKPMVDWKARIRTFENFRKEHGDKPVGNVVRQGRGHVVAPGDPVPATKPGKGKYKNKW